jgi:hypothetical protein
MTPKQRRELRLAIGFAVVAGIVIFVIAWFT